MLPPFVVEEHDGAFYIHHRGKCNTITRQREIGELAYDESFETYEDAQMKANDMEEKTGILW